MWRVAQRPGRPRRTRPWGFDSSHERVGGNLLDDTRPRVAPLDDGPDLDRVDTPDRQTPIPSPQPGRSRWRRIILGVLAVFLLLIAYPAWNALSIWNDWRNVERETFDSAAFERLPAVQAPTPEESEGLPEGVTLPTPVAAAPTGPTTYENFLIVGLDESEVRSDVIIMVMLPSDDSPPVMVSLPRDLYIPNRCTGGLTRINANFNGCGDINGATALSGAVKDFTGYEIDHFAIFTFDGFAAIIDQLGGFEVCLDRPLRERPKFELPAGCTQADGATTLGWVRSRKTEEFVDGRWRRIRTSSDLSRNARQQDLILTVFEGVADFSSPSEMTALVGSLSDAFTLDDRLGIGSAVDIAWNNRDLDPDTIVRPKIPVVDHVTSGGAQVLIPTKTFQEVLDEALAAG